MLGRGFLSNTQKKARPCSPWMPTPPTPCMHSDLHCNRGSVKGLPTDDTQLTEDMGLHREANPPTRKQLLLCSKCETHNYSIYSQPA